MKISENEEKWLKTHASLKNKSSPKTVQTPSVNISMWEIHKETRIIEDLKKKDPRRGTFFSKHFFKIQKFFFYEKSF